MTSSEQLTVGCLVEFTCTGWLNEHTEIPCKFAGFTDGVFDPETGTAQWSCEECETEYAEPRER